MQVRLPFSVLLLSALLLLASPAFSSGGSAPSGEGVSPRCEAAIDKAAGSYSRCLLKSSAKHAKKGNEGRLLSQEARCEDKFNAQVARALKRFGEDQCTPYMDQISERTASYAENVSSEAHGVPSESFLFVQNATGGTLSETALTLTGVSSRTGWFSDRPYREAGQVATDIFIGQWYEGSNSFAEDPPNADFTCTAGGEVVSRIVTLMEPSFDSIAGTLTYESALVPESGSTGSFNEITCDANAHLFIDPSAGFCLEDECNPTVVWSMGIKAANYNGPTAIIHPAYFYRVRTDGSGDWDENALFNQPGLHVPPGTILGDAEVQTYEMRADMEFNTLPTQDSDAQVFLPCDEVIPTSVYGAGGGCKSWFWKDIKYYTDLNGSDPQRAPESQEEMAGMIRFSADSQGSPVLDAQKSHFAGPLITDPKSRGLSYYGRVWTVLQGVSKIQQIGNPSSFITPLGQFPNTDDKTPNSLLAALMGNSLYPHGAEGFCVQPLAAAPLPVSPVYELGSCDRGVLWSSLEGGSGVWGDSPQSAFGQFPQYRTNATSIGYRNESGSISRGKFPAYSEPGFALMSMTLLESSDVDMSYTDSEGNPLKAATDTGYIGYFFFNVDGRLPEDHGVGKKFNVPNIGVKSSENHQSHIEIAAADFGQTLTGGEDVESYPLQESQGKYISDSDDDSESTLHGYVFQNGEQVNNENGFLLMPKFSDLILKDESCASGGDDDNFKSQKCWESTAGAASIIEQEAKEIEIHVDNDFILDLDDSFAGLVPFVSGSTTNSQTSSKPSCVGESGDLGCANVCDELHVEACMGTRYIKNKSRQLIYHLVKFVNQPAIANLKLTQAESDNWQATVEKIHQHVIDNSGSWPPGYRME